MTHEPYHMPLTCSEGFNVIKRTKKEEQKIKDIEKDINETRAQMIVKSRYIFPWLHQDDSSESK